MIDRGEPKTGVKDEGQIDQNVADQKLSFPATVFNIIKDTVLGFIDDDCLVLAGAIAYSALQSIIPLVLGFISVGSFFLQDPQTRQDFIIVLIATVPSELSSLVTFDDLIKNFINGAGLFGIISVIILLWTGSGVFGQLKYGVNKAYRIEKDLRNPILQISIQLLMLLILGGLMVLAFGFNILFGLFFNLKISVFGISPFSFNFVLPVLSFFIPFGLESAVFSFLYKFSPARKGVRWKPVILAGLITAGLFELLKVLFGVYVVVFNAAGSATRTYGAIGGIFVFLFFLYLTAIVILAGAELSARLHNFPEGLATAKSKEALVEIPAEEVQHEMVPKRFASAAKEAQFQNKGQISAVNSPTFSSSAKGSRVKPENDGLDQAQVSSNSHGEKQSQSGGLRQTNPAPAEKRLAMITGSIVLVFVAILGVLVRRKPPANF